MAFMLYSRVPRPPPSHRGDDARVKDEIHHVSDRVCFTESIERLLLTSFRQHNVVPEPSLVSEITHVAIAFMRSEIFNEEVRTEWLLFTSVEAVRPKFADGTIIQVAIGGWGDTAGFDAAARTTESRKLFARNVKAMLAATGADGVDIDWEYPGYVQYLACVRIFVAY
jgi:hypothetical protein